MDIVEIDRELVAELAQWFHDKGVGAPQAFATCLALMEDIDGYCRLPEHKHMSLAQVLTAMLEMDPKAAKQ